MVVVYDSMTTLINSELARNTLAWGVIVKQYRTDKSIDLVEFKRQLTVISIKNRALRELAFKLNITI